MLFKNLKNNLKNNGAPLFENVGLADIFAMISSAYIVFLPAAFFVLSLLALAVLFL